MFTVPFHSVHCTFAMLAKCSFTVLRGSFFFLNLVASSARLNLAKFLDTAPLNKTTLTPLLRHYACRKC